MVLPQGHTGSSFFHQVLSEAADEFPQALGRAELPGDTGAFKKSYGETLVRYELARLRSPRRVEIARFIAARTQHQLRYETPETALPFGEYLAQPVPAKAIDRTDFRGAPGFIPEVPFEGRIHRRRAILEVVERLSERHHLTRRAAAALRWIVEHIEERGGQLDLSGHRFAVLGAGAELAPTWALLKAGAQVLWVDVADPAALLAESQAFSGSLSIAQGARNLLTEPREIAATIAEFAAGEAVHIGMLAYAAGASQEWRLAASMNGIVRSLEPALIRSISLLVSPTHPAAAQPEDLERARVRLEGAPLWQGPLRATGALPVPGQHIEDNAAVVRAIVSIQGLSYQAAQYISKVLAAETYAIYGTPLEGKARAALRVSSNVPGITNTRSMSHPIFQAAFLGAPLFGVHIFSPDTTRALAQLLLFHDLFNPDAAGAPDKHFDDDRQKAAQLLSQQMHGGLYCLPYALEPAIRIAALIGLVRRPALLFQAFR